MTGDSPNGPRVARICVDSAATPGGGSVFTAVDKLGLKLDARKAPAEMIVIDHLEKAPTED